jgi:NAD(P)-dependent dehydrogenase (short-subunit alcohol dehydrogenase family)
MLDPAFTLDNKTAIVVGAAHGIGRASALAFAAAGAAVACADIEESHARATAAEIDKGGGRALPVRLDVTDGGSCRAAVRATVERFGGLDVLLYGAADSDRTATVVELSEAEWDRVVRINLTGAFLMARAAIPAMAARGGGSLILIASQLGRVASPGRAAYCATKGALIQLARVLATDHAAQGIRANTLSPGAVETRRAARPLEGHGRGAPRAGAPPRAGPPGAARGDCPRRRLPGQRRLGLHDGQRSLTLTGRGERMRASGPVEREGRLRPGTRVHTRSLLWLWRASAPLSCVRP